MHIWEASKDLNGPGAFERRLTLAKEKDDGKKVPRSQAEFAACALDPISQPQPQVLKDANIGGWVSLKDVADDKGNPFGDGTDVSMFTFTRANGQVTISSCWVSLSLH